MVRDRMAQQLVCAPRLHTRLSRAAACDAVQCPGCAPPDPVPDVATQLSEPLIVGA